MTKRKKPYTDEWPVIKFCWNCGSRNACPHIADDMLPCKYWHEGAEYGPSPCVQDGSQAVANEKSPRN